MEFSFPARLADRLRSPADELGQEPHALVLPLDLVAPGAAERLRDDLEARTIVMDGLVNCASWCSATPLGA